MAETASLICPECGNAFVVPLAQAHRRVYCSQSCRQSFNKVRVEGDVAYIVLENAKREDVGVTLVDVDQLELIRSFGTRVGRRWNENARSYYAELKPWENGERLPSVQVHRLVIGAPEDKGVDHISGDTLDNRRANLRLATVAENNQNRHGPNSNSTSGVRGVCWDKARQKWLANVRVNKNTVLFKRFDNKEDAEQAAIAARKEHQPFSNN